MPMGNVYTVRDSKTSWANSGICLELTAGSTSPLEILRVAVGQQTSTASAMVTAALARETATATFTAAQTPTPQKQNNRDAAANTTVKTFGTAAVTNGTGYAEVYAENFNVLNGWLYLPVPQETLIIPTSGFFAVALIGTVPSATWFVEVVLRELS